MPLIFQKKRIVLQKLAGFECDRCKKRFGADNTVAMDEMLHWRNTGGYGSVWGDGATMEVTLCQDCTHDLFAPFAVVTEAQIETGFEFEIRAKLGRDNGEENVIGTTYSSKLRCSFQSWKVIADGELALMLPAGSCCDMSGAISIAETIMPSVWRIATFAGNEADTEYRLSLGKWSAYDGAALAFFHSRVTWKHYRGEMPCLPPPKSPLSPRTVPRPV